MIRRQLLLIGSTVALWVAVALPARWAWGDAAAVQSGVAALLCLVPACVSLLWAGWAYAQPADKQLTMVLGGTGLRLFVIVGGAFALCQAVPYFGARDAPGFLIWVLVFYLFTLTLETVLSLAGRPAAEDPVTAGGAPASGR